MYSPKEWLVSVVICKKKAYASIFTVLDQLPASKLSGFGFIPSPPPPPAKNNYNNKNKTKPESLVAGYCSHSKKKWGSEGLVGG